MTPQFLLTKVSFDLFRFEVPYVENRILAGIYSLTNTWGHPWDEDGPKGPEPYIAEYQFKTRLPNYLERVGFENIEIIPYTFFESVFLANKPAA